ncbi:MAG: PEP-CTERM sorting domain-containing protein [Verrucomicrobia bacterium]|nr:PEP-CTERM sorting domain-containing protein [Verrucomicrobiota bacterium]
MNICTVDLVPEPSAFALLSGLAAMGLVMVRRRS